MQVKNNKMWYVMVVFINKQGKKQRATIRDHSMANIMSAVGCIPGIQMVSVVGERRAA